MNSFGDLTLYVYVDITSYFDCFEVDHNPEKRLLRIKLL